jgi:hypothetical protein
MPKRNIFLGDWRIVETELWEVEDLDLATPATLSLNTNDEGHLALIAVQAQLDYRVATRDGLPAVEFSFHGFDEGDEVMGRGWAVLEDGRLRGRLFFHQGDDTAFAAERADKARSRTTRRPANTALHRTARSSQTRRR